MTLRAEAGELLFRVWSLQSRLDYPAQVRLLSRVGEGVLVDEPELGYLLAQAQFYGGKWNEALRLLQLIERPLVECANERLGVRRTNLEAMVRLSLGDAVAAEALLLGALEGSARLGDHRLTAYARSNLGVLADIQCRWDEALVHYQHALAAYQNLGDKHGVGQIHHNTGMTYRQLGLYRSAAAHFEHALACLVPTGVQVDIAGSESERALLLGVVGDWRLAEVTARRALQRYSGLGHEPGVGEAHRVLGIIALHAGRFVDARRYLAIALDCTRRSGDRLTEAETMEELGVLEALSGDAGAAEQVMRRAAEIYRSYGAPVRAERMEARLRDAAGEPHAWPRAAEGSTRPPSA